MALFRFRFRSAARDLKSDQDRISSIRSAIHTSIASAEFELSGLSKRLNEAVAEAAAAYDAADESHSAREAQQEKQIASAESRLVAAQARSTMLRHFIAKLRDLEHVLNSEFREIEAAVPPVGPDPA